MLNSRKLKCALSACYFALTARNISFLQRMLLCARCASWGYVLVDEEERGEKTKTPPSHEGGISQLNTKLFLLTYLLSIFLLQSYGLFASWAFTYVSTIFTCVSKYLFCIKILDFSVECIKNEKLWNVQASFVKTFSVPLHSMLFQN